MRLVAFPSSTNWLGTDHEFEIQNRESMQPDPHERDKMSGPGGSGRLQRRLEGFPSLAYFINEDNDASIFRSFGELGARNLLYLQSNVNDLRLQLKRLDEEDANNAPGNSGLRISAREYLSLKAAAGRETSQDGDTNSNLQTGDGSHRTKYFSERVELHNKIKHAMREYRKF